MPKTLKNISAILFYIYTAWLVFSYIEIMCGQCNTVYSKYNLIVLLINL